MNTKVMIETLDGELTEELNEIEEKNYKGYLLRYPIKYFLDFAVDENTGVIDRAKKERFFTDEHMKFNRISRLNAYNIAKDSISPEEI